MEIKFSNLDFAYDNLNYDLRTEEEVYEELEENIHSIGFNFSPVQLPSPFKKGILTFRRNGEFYSSFFCLESKRSSVFKGLSETLDKRIKDDWSWSPMDNNGCGYILNKEKKPEISIISQNKEKDRLICLGSFGAIPKRFVKAEIDKKVIDFDNFIYDLKNLEKSVNIIVESCLLPFAESKEISSFPFPKHRIYVTS